MNVLWNKRTSYELEPFELESELEEAVKEVVAPLFGPDRIYLDVKRRISRKGGRSNIPDGYLIDLTSKRDPQLYVVENELARHEPLKHIAVQILEFSLAFGTSPRQVIDIVKRALKESPDSYAQCQQFAEENGHENVDVLLGRMVHRPDAFSALVIIDEVSEDLEQALVHRFKFPVEIVTLRRFKNPKGTRLYEFEPFLADLTAQASSRERKRRTAVLDPADVDTIVVPARAEGFNDLFIGVNRW